MLLENIKNKDVTPLMLAPMQGLTNRAMRSLFIERVRPDVVFTEFMRVNSVATKRLSRGDLREIADSELGVPLVVQLIGHGRDNLVTAAREAEDAGAVHINLNVGCPYGRMTTGLTGGRMLKRPEDLYEIVPALRDAVRGTFSVKIRAGYDNLSQIFELLPLFDAAGIDFLVVHPRTVVQEYDGFADHAVTAGVVRETRVPVVANGDIRTAADASRVMHETGAAGLMLGRGAIADPLLFERIRGRAPAEPTRDERRRDLQDYLREVVARYRQLVSGDAHVLGKVKGILVTLDDGEFPKTIKKLRKSRTVDSFLGILEEME